MKMMNMFWTLVDAALSKLKMFAQQDEKPVSNPKMTSPLEMRPESLGKNQPQESRDRAKPRPKPLGGVHNETATFNHPRKGLSGGRRH